MNATPLSGGGLISCQVIPPSCVVEKETMSNWTKLSPQDSASSFHPCWLSTNPRSGCPSKSPTGVQLWPPSWVRPAGVGGSKDMRLVPRPDIRHNPTGFQVHHLDGSKGHRNKGSGGRGR